MIRCQGEGYGTGSDIRGAQGSQVKSLSKLTSARFLLKPGYAGSAGAGPMCGPWGEEGSEQPAYFGQGHSHCQCIFWCWNPGRKQWFITSALENCHKEHNINKVNSQYEVQDNYGIRGKMLHYSKIVYLEILVIILFL